MRLGDNKFPSNKDQKIHHDHPRLNAGNEAAEEAVTVETEKNRDYCFFLICKVLPRPGIDRVGFDQVTDGPAEQEHPDLQWICVDYFFTT